MNTVERVKAICKERKIPISKLERDLGFGNGYIGQLRKGSLPDDRLKLIANYLNLSIYYLQNGEDPSEEYYLNDETAQIAQEIFDNPELRMLFDTARDCSPEDMKKVISMVKAFKGEL